MPLLVLGGKCLASLQAAFMNAPCPRRIQVSWDCSISAVSWHGILLPSRRTMNWMQLSLTRQAIYLPVTFPPHSWSALSTACSSRYVRYGCWPGAGAKKRNWPATMLPLLRLSALLHLQPLFFVPQAHLCPTTETPLRCPRQSCLLRMSPLALPVKGWSALFDDHKQWYCLLLKSPASKSGPAG